MRALGISIYPSHSDPAKDKAYLEKAAALGYTRIFTSMLELDGDRQEARNKYQEVIEFGNRLGMKTTLDINPGLFEQLGVSYDDLGFFHEMGAAGIRLDLGFDGKKEALMTKNPYGLHIEVNMSSGTKYIDNVMSYGPDTDRLIASHNFYPMRYSGLSRDHFMKTTQQYQNYYLNTAAFITSQTGQLGPWPVQAGLCTLEEHRTLPLAIQITHMRELGGISDIIIGNAYASDEELKAAAEAFFSPHLQIPIHIHEQATALERQLLLEELHAYRGDRSAYMIRSSMTRVKFKDHNFPIGHIPHHIQPGDLLIGNNAFGQYKGETQIALLPMEQEGQLNVVGHIDEMAMALIQDMPPFSTFELYHANA
ncbi:DUF871 domain-containing protein [Allofustis seminis]|uniref:DUF871 domain-containing protein n=1 Tax=Allofustis seminis TaxID=166939 RepID=UPI0003697FED|nr:MupG family TIM beta-alpha barrel fold protein [Allofustis seminis]